MKNLKALLPFMLLFCGVYFACNKDDIMTLPRQITSSFSGQIIDENGTAVLGARVSAGGKSAITDENGVFILNDIQVDARAAVIQVKKPGYFEFSRAYFMQRGIRQTITVQLLKKESPAFINASSGGSVSLTSGAKVVFPANGIVDLNGNAYNGQVFVYAHYLDPSDPELALKVPGDFRAVNASATEGTLATFGMIGVELETSSGQKLQLASGKEAEITVPIPADKMAVAPAQIALWHFDVATARWIEEGSAVKTGNAYVGKVAHFSFWNCDDFLEMVEFQGKLFIQNTQTPLSGVTVKLTVVSSGFQSYGTTNGQGWFGGLVPQDAQMKLEVVSGTCFGIVLHEQLIGPFSDDTTLPDIFVEVPSAYLSTITAHLRDCSAQPVTNGYAKIDIGGITSRICFPDANGDIQTQILNCDNSTSGIITAYDFQNLLKSNAVPFIIDNDNVVIGNIDICQTIDEYIEYTLDGQAFLFDNPFMFIEAIDSLGLTGDYRTYINNQTFNIFLTFESKNDAGTFPLTFFSVDSMQVDLNNSNMNTTVNAAPATIGDLLIGTFGNDYVDFSGNPHTISGSYRIKRTQ